MDDRELVDEVLCGEALVEELDGLCKDGKRQAGRLVGDVEGELAALGDCGRQDGVAVAEEERERVVIWDGVLERIQALCEALPGSGDPPAARRSPGRWCPTWGAKF